MENMILLIARKSSGFAYANRAFSHPQIERFRIAKSSVLHIDIRSCFRLDVKLSLMLFCTLCFVNNFLKLLPKKRPSFFSINATFLILCFVNNFLKGGIFVSKLGLFVSFYAHFGAFQCLFVVFLMQKWAKNAIFKGKIQQKQAFFRTFFIVF